MDQLMCASLFPHPLFVWSGYEAVSTKAWLGFTMFAYVLAPVATASYLLNRDDTVRVDDWDHSHASVVLFKTY